MSSALLVVTHSVRWCLPVSVDVGDAVCATVWPGRRCRDRTGRSEVVELGAAAGVGVAAGRAAIGRDAEGARRVRPGEETGSRSRLSIRVGHGLDGPRALKKTCVVALAIGRRVDSSVSDRIVCRAAGGVEDCAQIGPCRCPAVKSVICFRCPRRGVEDKEIVAAAAGHVSVLCLAIRTSLPVQG